ncbi:hypothetical protein ACFL3H_00275 [Gemmatimonadota bacterium]
MKSFMPVIVILSLIVVGLVLNSFMWFQDWLKVNKAFLDFITIIGVVGLLFSLALTVSQFRSTQVKEHEQRRQAFISRMTVLVTELMVNDHVCSNELLEPYAIQQEEEALPVPESRFHVAILEHALASGDIQDSETRMLLWNLYRLMSITNSLLSQALTVRHTEHIADPRDLMLIKGRRQEVNNLVRSAMEQATNVGESLIPAIQKVSELVECTTLD